MRDASPPTAGTAAARIAEDVRCRLDSSDLRALREKYELILALRLEHDAERASGLDHDAERAGAIDSPHRDERLRPRLQSLAARFPGALREVDDLPLADVRRRIEELASAEHDATKVTTWMTALHLFHAMTRGALCAKRWLSGRKEVDAVTRAAFALEAERLCWSAEARAWADELERIAAPPRGRVTDLVFERIARAMGIPEEGARQLVFGEGRRDRA
jgi:hypothetical protein